MCCVSCLETFSNNVTVPGLTPIPLNSISIAKGEFVSGNNGASSVEFNKCGVYKVSVSAVAVGSEEGDITIQLYKDNVAIQNALATSTVSTTTNKRSLSFTTLVQVPKNNNPMCPCSSPTTISIVNAGVEAIYNLIDVVVTKVD